jgi:selenocysteine-specific elongation factor
MSAEAWSAIREKALDAVAQHHRSRPHEPGLALSALAGALLVDAAIAEWLARELTLDGRLIQTGGLYRAPGFDLSKQGDETTRRIEDIVRRAGLHPPDEAEILRLDRAAAGALTYLVSTGLLIKTVDRVQNRAIFFHREAIEAARAILTDRLGASAGFSAGEAGAALGITRKFSIPLLEHLDSTRFTRRRGDRRVIFREAASAGVAAAPGVDRE